MTIQKIPTAELRKIGLHYTTITNEVMQLIKNPDSLAIWVYLMSQDENWIVRPTDIRTRFNIGKDRYSNAMNELKALGLCYVAIIRNDKGQVEKKTMVCSSIPSDWLDNLSIRPETRHDGGKPIRWESPQDGQSDHLIKDQLTNKPSIVNHPSESLKKFNDDHFAFAKGMYSLIKKVAPQSKEPNFEKWSDVIRLMNKNDKLDIHEMANVFRWANQDSFWRTNILSPSKFRKQYSVLHAKWLDNSGEGQESAFAEFDRLSGIDSNRGVVYDQ